MLRMVSQRREGTGLKSAVSLDGHRALCGLHGAGASGLGRGSVPSPNLCGLQLAASGGIMWPWQERLHGGGECERLLVFSPLLYSHLGTGVLFQPILVHSVLFL